MTVTLVRLPLSPETIVEEGNLFAGPSVPAPPDGPRPSTLKKLKARGAGRRRSQGGDE